MKTFTSTDPQNHSGENTWFTPEWLVKGLGQFDLDPCTQVYRPFDTAKIHFCESELNGLKEGWFGRVWLNPPYGKELGKWLEKFSNHREGIALIFARMGNEFIQNCIKKGANFFFFRKRVRFISKGLVSKYNPGADSCLMFFNKNEKKSIRNANFNGVFLHS